jgi:hypothetical protein
MQPRARGDRSCPSLRRGEERNCLTLTLDLALNPLPNLTLPLALSLLPGGGRLKRRKIKRKSKIRKRIKSKIKSRMYPPSVQGRGE